MPNTGKNPYGGEMADANIEWMRRFDPRYWQQFQNLPNARLPYGAPPEGPQRRPTEPEMARNPSAPRPVGSPAQGAPSGLTRLSPGVYRNERTGELVRDADGRMPAPRGSARGMPPPGLRPQLSEAPPMPQGGISPGSMPTERGTQMPGTSPYENPMDILLRRRRMQGQVASPDPSLPNTGYDPNSLRRPGMNTTWGLPPGARNFR